MRSRDTRWVAILLCLLMVGGLAATGTAAATGPGHAHPNTLASTHVDACAATPPADGADPDGNTSEVIGWVDGFWYNDTVDIEDPDALTEEELEALTARTAARVEALRCLTFEEIPPIEMVTRDERREDVESFYRDDLTDEDRQFLDAQLATMLKVGTAENATEVMIESRTAFAAAFYNVEDEFIGIITDDPDAIQVDQVTLAHELLHALQDQHFDLDAVFEEPTTDQFRSSLHVVEGEAVLVDGMYEDNCDVGVWVDECIRLDIDASPPPNWGIAVEQFAPYSAPLVATVYRDDGWAGVSALHEAPPDSMVEVLQPATYGEFERAAITVPDRSADDWHRLEADGQEFDIVGQHTLTAMLMAPAYETGGDESVIDIDPFFRQHAGGSLNYDHPATDGWQADKLYAYASEDGDLGGVWKLAWADAETAERFVATFEELIAFRGGEQSAEYANVYTFEGSDAYDMALSIEQDGDRVWIVTAPTVAQLTDVHGDVTTLAHADLAIAEVTPADAELAAGDTLELSVTVENRGDVAAQQSIEARHDGEVLGTEPVELEPGDSETVRFAFDSAGEPPGETSIEVRSEDDAATTTVTILEADDDAVTVTDDPAADDTIPGFTAVGVVFALLVGAFGLRSRRS